MINCVNAISHKVLFFVLPDDIHSHELLAAFNDEEL